MMNSPIKQKTTFGAYVQNENEEEHESYRELKMRKKLFVSEKHKVAGSEILLSNIKAEIARIENILVENDTINRLNRNQLDKAELQALKAYLTKLGALRQKDLEISLSQLAHEVNHLQSIHEARLAELGRVIP
jgi:hypothetical protein